MEPWVIAVVVAVGIYLIVGDKIAKSLIGSRSNSGRDRVLLTIFWLPLLLMLVIGLFFMNK